MGQTVLAPFRRNGPPSNGKIEFVPAHAENFTLPLSGKKSQSKNRSRPLRKYVEGRLHALQLRVGQNPITRLLLSGTINAMCRVSFHDSASDSKIERLTEERADAIRHYRRATLHDLIEKCDYVGAFYLCRFARFPARKQIMHRDALVLTPGALRDFRVAPWWASRARVNPRRRPHPFSEHGCRQNPRYSRRAESSAATEYRETVD
jgi:hypothetical protein